MSYRISAAVGATCFLAQSVWSLDTETEVGDAERASRTAALLARKPGISPQAVDDYLHRSDRVKASLANDDGALDDVMARQIEETDVTDEEVRAWYESHRDVFGSRPYAGLVPQIERIVRLEKARAALEARGTP